MRNIFRLRAPLLPTAISLLALTIAMGGTAVAVAPTVVNIADPTTPTNTAHVDAAGKMSVGDGAGAVTVDGTVTSQVAPSTTVLHFAANVPAGSGGCLVLATPPAGKAMIVDQVRVNVTSDPAPGSGHNLGFYTGQCVRFVGEVTPATVGQTAMTFGAGLGINAASNLPSLNVQQNSAVAANVFVDAHTVASSAVPATGVQAPQTPHKR